MILSYPDQQVGLDLVLAPGTLVDVRPTRKGVEITLRSGRLWITQTGDPGDHILNAGETFRAPRKGLLVIQALEPSVFTSQVSTGSRASRGGGGLVDRLLPRRKGERTPVAPFPSLPAAAPFR